MTFSALQFPFNSCPDHVQAILVAFACGIQPSNRFLGQRHQKAFIPEFLASHTHKINRI